MHMQWHITTSTFHTIYNLYMESFISCMKCFHAHTPSHSPTPSQMPMPSVAFVTGNTNDTHIPSLCWLTNTQRNFPIGNQSQVNPNSDHSTLGLSDKHDRVFSFWAIEIFGLHRGSLTPIQKFWITPRVSYTNVLGFSPKKINGPLLALPNTH